MELGLSRYFRLASKQYTSPSQIARVISENWFMDNAYCPSCSRDSIREYPANHPVIDFYCSHCKQDYQLKGKRGLIGRKVLDGQYDTIMRAVNKNQLPNFAFLIYDPTQFEVTDLFYVPKYFFSPSIIEKRTPLSLDARRAGWIGCNILFYNIPEIAKIHAVKNSEIIPSDSVYESWNKIRFMSEFKRVNARGWTSDIIHCVDLIEKSEFDLSDCYKFEGRLKHLHPENQNIKPKIRQQLQIMRDKGLIEFVGKGRYRKR
jgi:type II restriction enzyme